MDARWKSRGIIERATQVVARRLPTMRQLLALFMIVAAHTAQAMPVGLTHRDIALASAAARRSDHKPLLEVTIWYPATNAAKEVQVDIGPSARALLVGARSAVDARPRPGTYPVVLLSHGFGGSAADLSWLAAGLAANGYVVVGVDHPGNNAMDRTPVGGTAWWERPRDLIAALQAVSADQLLGRHLDLSRLGAAGFSMGGMTALALGGATIDPGHFDDFCATHPPDQVCDTAPETPDAPHLTQRAGIHLLGLDDAAAAAARGTMLPGLRAILAIAPPVQMLAADSLPRITAPTTIVVGGRDRLVPAGQEAAVAARAIPGARLVRIPGVAHYSFIGSCTRYGREVLSFCALAPEQERAHAIALREAIMLFRGALANPRGRSTPPIPPAP